MLKLSTGLALAAVGTSYGACAACLVREAAGDGRATRVLAERVVAGVCAVAALVLLHAAARWFRRGAVVAVRERRTPVVYLVAFLGIAALVLVGLHAWSAQLRPALAATCFVTAASGGLLLFANIPSAFATRDALFGLLGNRLRFSEVSSFSVGPARGRPARVSLELLSGRGDRASLRLSPKDAAALAAVLEGAQRRASE